MKELDTKQLFEKYNKPAPRYTSYPASKYWDNKSPDAKKWLKTVRKNFEKFNQEGGIGLYVHMPFCESLCTFCGFEKRITTNHFVEEIYVDALIKHWQIYLDNLSEKPKVKMLHMGGGTPTFFAPENLKKLYTSIISTIDVPEEHEYIFEGHPNSTELEHLQVLYDLGFRKVSYGIQDFNPQVQKSINRVQEFDKVQEVVENSRKVGYNTVKFDLIYGLPYQNANTIKETIEKVGQIMPEQIAFYSYIHVPWERPSQNSFKENSLPQGLKKRSLFEVGKEELQKLGYEQVGMDHFALKSNSLYQAYKNKQLKRNLTGYSHLDVEMLLGIGAIALSDGGCAYAQNTVSVEDYHDKVFSGNLPLAKTHFLNKEDCLLKNFIQDIMCKEEAKWSQELFDSLNPEAKYEVIEIQKDGLIDVSNKGFIVTDKGKPFVRSISLIFDARYHKKPHSKKEVMFSSTI
ncbi:MAG: oxygen-independent coproporphyrinogen III oxidase [Candidatus Cyclobacteriaceae bacterium M3_2C_046]